MRWNSEIFVTVCAILLLSLGTAGYATQTSYTLRMIWSVVMGE